ncbi:GreA/GreB family elongation factor [Paenibacillus chitinolyticus]|uniref:GreA/GreB family elongation factor n=1 Tax=Paenibacillus chitinolyticus TaxID=79263 RepID=UPI0036309C6E
MNLSLTGSRHQLINQLVYFDEELHQFLELYFPSPTKSRTYTEERLQEYSEALTGLISEFSEELLHSKVLIGSKVQIRYLDDNQSDTYSIVFPSKTDPSSNRISFLSPIGSHLLLGTREQTFTIQTPSGEYSVRIEDIRYMNAGDV